MFAPAGLAPRPAMLAVAVLSGLAPSCTTTGDRTALMEILTRIEQREVADGFLQQALEQGDEPTRAWAARGLGASRSAAALAPLIQSLADESTWVRSAGLFALPLLDGLTPEQSGVRERTLLEHLESSEPVLRFLAAQALGRAPSRAAVEPLVKALVDPAPNVRRAAAFSLLQLAGDRTRQRPGIGLDDPQRSDVLTTLERALAIERDQEVRWHLVYALAHCVDPSAAATLRSIAVSKKSGRWERLFAIRGLGHLPGAPANRNALAAQLRDEDPVLVAETLSALHRLATTASQPARNLAPVLRSIALEHEAASIRAQAIRTLAAVDEGAEPVLASAAEDPSWTVRAAALEAQARRGDRQAIAQALRSNLDWRAQLGAARGVAHFEPAAALAMLGSLPQLDPRVELAILDSVAKIGKRALTIEAADDGAAAEARRGALRQLADWTAALLERDDPAFLEATADALAGLGATHQLSHLAAAWRRALGRIAKAGEGASEPAFASATARAQVARAIAQLTLDDAARRKVARDESVLREIADTDPVEFVRRATGLGPSESAAPTTRPGPEFGEEITTEFLFRKPRPRIRFRTVRGEFLIELLPELAPVHCFNLLHLVAKGDYDERLFHRVVPNFVIQGGDARGDGFGNVAWYDGPLRDELNPLPLVAGRVGMPRTQDRDTGGDQLFITTVPTPHLDGHYTAFARVVAGMDTIRRIEVGDVINSTEIVH